MNWFGIRPTRAARDLYNFAVGGVSKSLSTLLDPWDKPLPMPSPDGVYLLTTDQHHEADRDPAEYNIVPADSIVIGGAYFEKPYTVPGVGAPVVAIGREEKTTPVRVMRHDVFMHRDRDYSFRRSPCEIEFIEPFATDKVTLGWTYLSARGRLYRAARDRAGTERPDKLGLIRLLRPDKYADTARLTRLQPYDPNRTPVIFVHGLQDTPASWAPMINTFRADPEIRRRYQFWVYSYPSGYPYLYSAALFRQELDGIARAFPDHKRIVLVGHSMGDDQPPYDYGCRRQTLARLFREASCTDAHLWPGTSDS